MPASAPPVRARTRASSSISSSLGNCISPARASAPSLPCRGSLPPSKRLGHKLLDDRLQRVHARPAESDSQV
jgi:hypothetical protein